jgi:predicted nucleic acid-binding protein
MYLDSAIIVKLLVREAGSEWFEQNLSGQSFESSELSLVEVCAALLFKERKGEIAPDERVQALEKIFLLVKSEMILLYPLNREVLERARSVLLACHPHIPLRSLDALHVATCDLNRCSTMSATDRRIRAACKQLGIALMPGENEDIAATK